MEDRTLLASFLVINTVNSGPGSLRQAILDSDAATGGTNTIDFNIPGSGVQTIAPLSALAAITQSVLIDGFSQPGYGETPLIELSSGSHPGGGDGLTITGSAVTVRGLDINGFAQAPAFTSREPARPATGSTATSSAPMSTVRRPWETRTPASRSTEARRTIRLAGQQRPGNIISGNGGDGIQIYGSGTSNNLVEGNYVGVNAGGTAALGNADWGVILDSALQCSRRDHCHCPKCDFGNQEGGVAIYGGSAVNDLVEGNYIGTDITGTVALGRRLQRCLCRLGSRFSDNPPGSASDNTIGGTAPGAGNVISANGNWGIWITGVGPPGSSSSTISSAPT